MKAPLIRTEVACPACGESLPVVASLTFSLDHKAQVAVSSESEAAIRGHVAQHLDRDES